MQGGVRVKATPDPSTLMVAAHLAFGASGPKVVSGRGRLRPELPLEQRTLARTVEHARCDLRKRAYGACRSADEPVAGWVGGCVQDHLGDVLGRVHGRWELRLIVRVVSDVLRHRRADRTRLN